MLIALRGTEFNRRLSLFRGLERFNLGLALIGFRTTGAWSIHMPSILDIALAKCQRATIQNNYQLLTLKQSRFVQDFFL